MHQMGPRNIQVQGLVVLEDQGWTPLIIIGCHLVRVVWALNFTRREGSSLSSQARLLGRGFRLEEGCTRECIMVTKVYYNSREHALNGCAECKTFSDLMNSLQVYNLSSLLLCSAVRSASDY